ncbi:hypothetical protein [Chryseolinea serpens]|uniref:hypothetical protein n=1 Tax=Chryseolinea serpens TaxID=947013 RepID=UPI0011614F7A|nr:hypothetical protein [Chryseolinea serpens]
MKNSIILIIALSFSTPCHGQLDSAFFNEWQLSAGHSFDYHDSISGKIKNTAWGKRGFTIYLSGDVRFALHQMTVAVGKNSLLIIENPTRIELNLRGRSKRQHALSENTFYQADMSIFGSRVSLTTFESGSTMTVGEAYFHDTVSLETRKYNGSWEYCGLEKKLLASHNFIEYISFENCGFREGANFNFSSLNHFPVFKNCTIKGKLDLSYTKIDSTSIPFFNTPFFNTPLPDSIDLSHSKLGQELDLTTTFLRKGINTCCLNLFETDASKIKLQYRNFQLYFVDSVHYNKKYYDGVSSTYERLLAGLKTNGFTDSYRKLDIEYHDWQKHFDSSLWIADLWWRYGYQKWRIVLYSLSAVLFFSFFNYRLYDKLQAVYPNDKLDLSHIPENRNLTIQTIKRYIAILLYTGIIFFRFNIDLKNMEFFPLRYSLLIIFQYTIGLVCTGFLINWIIG